jgi:two-component system, chemotaxis family, sensor kinase CheA
MSDRDDQFVAGFMDDYFAECDEHLQSIRDDLLKLEASIPGGRTDDRVLEELFLSFHSLKGISGMVELREAEMLAHEMENYLRALRARETTLSQAGVDALITGVDALEQVVRARRTDRALPAITSSIHGLAAVVPALERDAPRQPPAGAAPADADWIVTFTPSMALNARGINVDAVRSRLRQRGNILQASPRILESGIAFEFGFAGDLDADTLEAWKADGIMARRVTPASGGLGAGAPLQSGAGDPLGAAGGVTAPASHYVRVDLAKLDELMRMIADLVISRARLEDSLSSVEARVPSADWRGIHENAATIERQLRDLREGVVRVRLVPVGEIFRRMPFVVRDLARESGAKVRLTLEGQETEIDKFLIERMMDPVLHLVRNAVSHGFELPEERRAAGKPEEGTLTLSAAAAGESVVIEIADDGRGIDADDVVRRARLAGLAVPDGPLDSAALLELISAPGLSTRDETDRASGRGVGMSVVRSTIQQLNGTMTLDSRPGHGTRFTIELPLTLSITDAMIATVGARTFAVPQSAVREVIEIEPGSVRQIENHEIAPYRGGTLPIVRLSRLFGIAGAPRRALHAFVIGAGADAVGLVVDRISGQREIVVRPTADPMIKVDGVSGATDLGDGKVVLILNMTALARAGRSGGFDPAGAARRTRSA